MLFTAIFSLGCTDQETSVACPSGTSCAGDCVDVDTSSAHCGACGNACAAGEVCADGACALSCQAGLTDCNGQCINTQADLAHCGACGRTCMAGEVCSGGACALSCQAGLTDCNGQCVNTQSDLAHCGACGKTCVAGEVCSGGACALSCQAGLTDCNGQCVDTKADLAHCGACGKACAADAVCSDSECVSTTPVTLQLVTVSDWHGQLDPLTVSNVDIGGAAALSSYFKNERASNPFTLTLTAGDAYGASPPLASFFDEVPAIKAMNLMGFDADTFGNHNFDRGTTHLQSMIDLASFTYVSSNLNNLAANLSSVASPYHLIELGGVKVALIGITTPDAQELTSTTGLGTMTVADPVMSAMAARDAAQAAGARVFVALAHMGASTYNPATTTWTGPLIDLANGLTGFHAVVGDHTDIQVNTIINGAAVVENRSRGLTYARIQLTVVPYTGALVDRKVTLVSPVASAVTADPAMTSMLAPYRTSLIAALDGVVGVATDVFPRANNAERLSEVAIGNLIADAFRVRYMTQLALITGGNIRAPLPSSYLPGNLALRRTSPGYAAGPPYDLVAGDVYTVLPFGNAVVTRTVTGAQLWAALENGVSALPGAAGRFPQIAGFRFTYTLSQPAGSRIVSVTLSDNTPIPPDATVYSLATLDFLNSGGDGYTVLADGTGTSLDLAAAVVSDHIATLGTIVPAIEGRILAAP
jgi:5'-nucleotidase